MGEAFLLSLQMFGLVIVVSMLVAAMIRAIVYTLSMLQKKRQPATAPAAKQPVVPAAAEPDPAQHDIAVIAAAVYATVGAHRILHIEDRRGPSWTVGGRLAHHGSHAVPHRPRR